MRALLSKLTPLPAVPPDTTNRVADNAQAAALGQKLFFDAVISGSLEWPVDLGAVGESGKVSCASCHSSSYLDDARSVPKTVALGVDFHRAIRRRSSMHGFMRRPTGWPLLRAVGAAHGRPRERRDHQRQPTPDCHRIFDAYRAEYELVFGAIDAGISDLARFPANGKPKPAPTPTAPNPPDGPWEAMTPADRLVVNTVLVNYSEAVAGLLRLLVSRNSPLESVDRRIQTAVDDARPSAVHSSSSARADA